MMSWFLLTLILSTQLLAVTSQPNLPTVDSTASVVAAAAVVAGINKIYPPGSPELCMNNEHVAGRWINGTATRKTYYSCGKGDILVRIFIHM
jgi:hypothetical protein